MRDGAYHRLCRQFQQAFIQAGAPADMALFAEKAASGNIRRVYVSPAAVPAVEALLASYGSVPCEQPDPVGLSMVFGVPGAARGLLDYRDGAPGRASERLSERRSVIGTGV